MAPSTKDVLDAYGKFLRIEELPAHQSVMKPGAAVPLRLVSVSPLEGSDSIWLEGIEQKIPYAGLLMEGGAIILDERTRSLIKDMLSPTGRERFEKETDGNSSIEKEKLAKLMDEDDGSGGLKDLINALTMGLGGGGGVNAEIVWVVTRNADGTDEILRTPATVQDFVGSVAKLVAGMLASQPDIQIKPPVREMAKGFDPTPVIYWAHAEVTLSIGKDRSVYPTPPVPIPVLPLLIPTTAFFFIDRDFNGRFAMQVPDDSFALDPSPIFNALHELRDGAQGLLWLGGFVSNLLPTLGALLDTVLPATPAMTFLRRTYVSDFDDFPDYKSFLGTGVFGIGPDDECSSIMFFAAHGCPHSRLTVFDEDEGQGTHASIDVDESNLASVDNLEYAWEGKLQEISASRIESS